MNEEELGEWRRSHYSSQINPSIDGLNVTIMGWVSSIRDHGNIFFIMLRDRFGDIQVIAKKGECNIEVFNTIKNLREHFSVGIKGIARTQSKAPRNAEVIPQSIRVFSIAKISPPFMVQGKTSVGLDTRLELRAIDLRRDILQSIIRIRYTVLNSIREFLKSSDFIEVNTPKMIASATEGGAALFPIFYYDREAFLAQSPQLYKEQLTMSLDNVFEISPIFRAEPSRTNRHLSEAISIDVEKSFVDYTDVMKLLENLIINVIDAINTLNKEDLDLLKISIVKPNLPFPRYTYDDIVNKIIESNDNLNWGDDLNPNLISNISSLNTEGFYFIVDWPTSSKPFYVKPKLTDNKVSESFDLMFGALEISSGSSRINRKDFLIERMQQQGLNSNSFDYHLKVFDYGMPPHAGFGVGLERLLMILTKTENIRDVTFYPRDIDRLSP